MKLGINIHSKWPYDEVIKAFVKNGINRTFVCIDHPQFEEVMDALSENGIVVDNFHAPFSGMNRIWEDGEDGDFILQHHFLDSVDACVKYNIPILVVHASVSRPMPPISEIGVSRFDKFMEYAKSKSVCVAFESHRYLENMKFMLDRYPEARFCMDTCHAHGFTPDVDYMAMFGDRLVATHISDNDSVCDKDMHMLPFDGIIDFDKFAQEVVACGYDGTLMLEIKPGNHALYSDLTIEQYYTEAAKRIKKLGAMVDCKTHSKEE